MAFSVMERNVVESLIARSVSCFSVLRSSRLIASVMTTAFGVLGPLDALRL